MFNRIRSFVKEQALKTVAAAEVAKEERRELLMSGGLTVGTGTVAATVSYLLDGGLTVTLVSAAVGAAAGYGTYRVIKQGALQRHVERVSEVFRKAPDRVKAILEEHKNEEHSLEEWEMFLLEAQASTQDRILEEKLQDEAKERRAEVHALFCSVQ